MPTFAELRALISDPRETVDVEFKAWLDPTSNHGKATIARAAIALANHGGGLLVIGFDEQGETLNSSAKPEHMPALTQDLANAAVKRFAEPEFHVEVYRATHPTTAVEHVIVSVPGGQTVPIMSRRDCENVIARNRCYIRKPGPRSEEPQTQDEWRTLLNRCVRAQREDMLDAIRAIVTGRVEATEAAPDAEQALAAFAAAAHDRWSELTRPLDAQAPARFPHGSYEMAFGLVGAEPCASLGSLQQHLAVARRIKLTGWSTFLELSVPGLAPYPHDDFVEAWVGRPVRDDAAFRDASLCDFWRASRQGQLYTIRGYAEDSIEDRAPGRYFDVTLPVWRVGEGLLFAARLAEAFGDVEQILIRCRFTGLQDRVLTSVTRRRMMFDDSTSHTDAITLSGQATPAQIMDNLAEVLLPLLSPLYEKFDFFQLSPQLVGQECRQLQQNGT